MRGTSGDNRTHCSPTRLGTEDVPAVVGSRPDPRRPVPRGGRHEARGAPQGPETPDDAAVAREERKAGPRAAVPYAAQAVVRARHHDP